MTRQTYLNPQIIQLDNLDFVKLDIIPGTAEFKQADFAVHCAGSINELSITVDRINNEVIKSTSGPTDALVMYTDNTNTKFFVSDTDNTSGTLSDAVILNTNIVEADFHNNIKVGLNTKHLIHGALFTLIVKNIFPQAITRNLDTYDSTIRSNKVFFKTDATEGDASADPVVNSVIQDITLKTLGIFNETIGGLTDEYNYWNVRTGEGEDDDEVPPDYLEQDTVRFANGDKMYCYYQITTEFLSGTTTDLEYNDFQELNALSATGTQENPSPYASAQISTTFVLGYDILKAGAVFVYSFDNYTNLKSAVTQWCDAAAGGDTSTVEGVFGHISNWDVSNITDMQDLFPNNTDFNDDISSWDVSNVVNMKEMFDNAKQFDQDISSWDVSKVTDMYRMFRGASKFNNGQETGIGSWNTSQVTNIKEMFKNASSFDQDISSWDVSNVNWNSWGYSENYGYGSGHSDTDFTGSQQSYFT